MQEVLTRLGFTLDYFQSVLDPESNKNFCLWVNYSFKILSEIRHVSQIFGHFTSKSKKFRPDRIGAGIDPLKFISGGHVSTFATSKKHVSLPTLFFTQVSSSTKITKSPWRVILHGEVYNSTRLHQGQTVEIRRFHCSNSTDALFQLTYVQFLL